MYGRYGRNGNFLLLDQDDSRFGEVHRVIEPETVLTFPNDDGGYFSKKIIWRGRTRLVLIRLNANETNLSRAALNEICQRREGFLLRNKIRVWWGLHELQPNIPFAIARGKRN